MTYDFDSDNSWLDAMVQDAPAKASNPKVITASTSKGLFCWSDDYRAKISDALKGKTHTAEHKAKISAAIKGKTHTAKTRDQMSATRKGKSRGAHPQEHCAKISAALKGKTHSVEACAKIQANNSQSKPIMTPTGAFPSKSAAGEWAQAHGLINAHRKINKWLKTHPDQFYYIPKDTK